MTIVDGRRSDRSIEAAERRDIHADDRDDQVTDEHELSDVAALA